MKRHLLASAVLSVILTSPQLAMAGPGEDMLSKWEASFNAGNVDEIATLYAPDATLFGTLSPSLSSGIDAVKAYFTASAKRKTHVSIVGAPTVTKISDTAMVVSGLYEFSGTRPDGQSFAAPARFSFVIGESDGKWLIVHQHSSPRPKPPQ